MPPLPPPPDRPTEPLPPHPATPIVEERVPVVATAGPRVVRETGSLHTALALVGLLAVAALAVAIYALVNSDSAGKHGRYASSARVSAISRRVDSLTAQLQVVRAGKTATTTAVAGDTAALSSRVAALQHTVSTLSGRADPAQAVAQLSSRLDTLAAQVSQLKQTTTTTP